MVPLQQETNIEVFRYYTQWLIHKVQSQSEEITRLRNEGKGSCNQESLNAELRDRLTRLQKKLYGFGQEALPNGHRPSGHGDRQLNLHTQRRSEDTKNQPNKKTESQRRAKLPTDSPVEKIHLFRDEDLHEESQSRGVSVGKEAWKKIAGLYQESTTITVVERVYQKVVHKQAKYRLKDEYNTSGKEVIITAPGPVKVRPGSQYSVDFALSVVTDKYEYHLPLERQRRKMEAAGLQVDVKTLYGLCEAVAEHCESVREGIRQDIMSDFPAVHLDETPWRILGDKKQGYLWVMSNRTGCYYQFEPTRSGKVSEELLKGYKGAIVVDGFSGYNRVGRLENIRVQHCWSHARREFYERYEDFPKEVTEAIRFIDRIFEGEAKASSVEHLRELRKSEINIAVNEFLQWLYETKPKFLPSEGISKAIAYTLNQWQGLIQFLSDLSVPISNNDAERALRHAVVGRKNFAGSKTINGADTAAALYTVIETCKRNELQPTEYLEYLIAERWHGRKPKTPFEYVVAKRGLNSKLKWPERENWRV